MSDKEGAIVTGRVGDPRFIPVEGTVHGSCQQCHADVYLAPSSQNLLRSNPELSVLCMDCAEADIQKRKDSGEKLNFGTAKGAWEEIIKHLTSQN